MTIYAYTDIENTPPAYVNLSKKEDGKYVLVVRTKGTNNASQIEMPFMELLKLQSAILSIVSFEGDDE